jgi:hypothetical protein
MRYLTCYLAAVATLAAVSVGAGILAARDKKRSAQACNLRAMN